MKILKFFLFLFMFCYICYHAFYGKRNVWNYFDKKVELSQLEEKIKEKTERNNRLKNKIDRFSDEKIDLDLLDEVSRDVLGTSGVKDEIIIVD